MAQRLPATVECILQPSLAETDLIRAKIATQLPKEGSQEHLIKVHAVAPCADELTWSREFPDQFSASKTNVPCFDMAGTVVQAPKDSPFQPGTHVVSCGDYAHTGHARQYTVAPQSQLALKPQKLSWEEAASVPVSAVTAFEALFDHAHLALGWRGDEERKANTGKRILITAASGGVGIWAIQLARLAGISDIVAVCGTDNVNFVKSIGASEVIDYRKTSIRQWIEQGHLKVDVVLDMVGRQTLTDCWGAVKDKGILISVYEPPRRPQGSRDIKSLYFIFARKGEQLAEVARLIDAGELRATVDSVWPFERYQDAFAKVANGHCRGKVILKL